MESNLFVGKELKRKIFQQFSPQPPNDVGVTKLYKGRLKAEFRIIEKHSNSFLDIPFSSKLVPGYRIIFHLEQNLANPEKITKAKETFPKTVVF